MGSIAQHTWKIQDLQDLKNILIQATCALFSAFLDIGFVHLDLHLDNVLLRKTKKQEMHYKCIDKKIKTKGFYPIIMDFGRAKTSATLGEFKTSLLKMYSLLRDIGDKTHFILDPLPLVSYIKNSQTFNIDQVICHIENIKIDYVKLSM
jgi:predicted unusual protein kinase regulating ubiquinone biosynthesis (AarF/ABC1/UbiB family)